MVAFILSTPAYEVGGIFDNLLDTWPGSMTELLHTSTCIAN